VYHFIYQGSGSSVTHAVTPSGIDMNNVLYPSLVRFSCIFPFLKPTFLQCFPNPKKCTSPPFFFSYYQSRTRKFLWSLGKKYLIIPAGSVANNHVPRICSLETKPMSTATASRIFHHQIQCLSSLYPVPP
jgi:hypothetical protein